MRIKLVHSIVQNVPPSFDIGIYNFGLKSSLGVLTSTINLPVKYVSQHTPRIEELKYNSPVFTPSYKLLNASGILSIPPFKIVSCL